MKSFRDITGYIDRRLRRNEYDINYQKVNKDHVIIEHSSLNNAGDYLGPVIVDWMLDRKGIDRNRSVKRTKHLMTVGSIIGRGRFDCTIWGSGILKYVNKERIVKLRKTYHRVMDIRAVRGPESRDIIISAGYDCPPVYGDPAVLMPMIYHPGTLNKEYEISVILHHRTSMTFADTCDNENYVLPISNEFIEKNKLHFIDPKTSDYKHFIDEITKSKRIISSSLHGIILAEAYRIPAVFLNWGMDDQPIKFMDWYQSTGRTVSYTKTLEDAIDAEPAIPDLSYMQDVLIKTFPYDLWEDEA